MKNVVISLVALFGAGLPPAGGAVIVYENFEASSGYTAGNTLNGVSPTGATGLSGPWAVSPTPAGAATQFTAQAGTMSYAGGDISVSGGSQFARMVGGSANIAIPLAATQFDTNGYYFSFLMRGSGITNNEHGSLLWARSTNPNAENIAAGIGGTNTTTTNQGVYSRDSNGSSGGTAVSSLNSGTPNPFVVTSGQTYFLTGKLVSNGTNFTEMYIWINPTNGVTEGLGAAWSSADILNVNVYNGNITHLALRNFGMAAGDTFEVDEVRLGQSWEDVVVIPEPSTIALFAAAGLLFLAVQCRGRR